ncbi:unnamed protein product [Closterium sp. NIES-65]|nr:unnamed protein product [Closterium sp. NIES-65]
MASELACTYAALILHDDGIPITADKIATLVKAANVNVEAYWPTLFAKLLEKRSVEDLVSNIGSGGGGAVAAPAAAGGAAAPAAEEKKEEKKELLGEELGKGANGRVFKALDLQNGDFVAVKEVSLENIDQDDLASVMQEIDLLKTFNHKNIVKYLGSIKTKTHLFILLEFVENGSLAGIIKPNKFGPFPECLVAVYTAQVLEGLMYLHEQGIIHCDIKGANILTTKEGLVKLADFGVAMRVEEAAACHGDAENPNVVGTPYWMAPEVIEMSGISPASDIWSVGCTVIELLTTKPPYFDLQPMPALFRIVQDDMPPIPENVSAATSDFLHLCFRKDTKSRPDAKTLLRHPWIRQAKRAVSSGLAAIPRPVSAGSSSSSTRPLYPEAPSQGGAGRGSDEAAAIDDSIDAARRVHATSHASSSSSSPPVTLSASSPDSERRDRKIHLQADAVKDLREAAKAARKSRAQRHSMGGSIDSGAPSDRPGTAEDAGSGGAGAGGVSGGSGISSSGIPLSGSGRRKIIRSKSDKELNARDSEGHAEGGAGGAGGKDGARRQRWKSGQGMDEEGSREFISMQGEGGVWEVSDEEDGLGKVKGGRRGAGRERAEEEDSSGEIGSGEARQQLKLGQSSSTGGAGVGGGGGSGASSGRSMSAGLASPPRSHRGSRSQQQSPEGAHGRLSFEAPQKVSRSQQQSPEGAHGRASGGRSGGENFLVGSSGEEGGADQEDERNGTPAGRKARRRSQDGDGTGAEGGGAGKKGAGKKKEQRRSGPLSAPTGKSGKGAGKKRGSQQQQAQQDDDCNNDNSGKIVPGSSSLLAPHTPPQPIPRPLSTFIETEEERSLSSLTAMFSPLAGSPQVAGGSRSLAGVLRERLVRGMHRVAVKAEREGSDLFAGVEGLDAVGSGAERGEEEGGAVGVVGGVGVVGEFDSAVYGGAAGGGAECKSSLRPELLNQKVSEAAGLLSQLKPSQGEEAIEVASSRLAGLVGEYPEVKGELVATHAVLPLLDVFDADSPRIVLAVLGLLQQLITDSPAIQSLLCNAGLVPTLLNFSSPGRCSPDMRHQAGLVLRHLCHSSPDAVRALLACRGLPTLMAFLETDYCNNRAFVHIGLDCLLEVLAAGRPTPRTDIARQLARMGLLHRLLSLLHSVSSARNHPASASSAGAGAGAGGAGFGGEGGGEGGGRSSWDGGAAGSGGGSVYGSADAYGSGNTGGAGAGAGGGGAASAAASPATSSSTSSAAAPAAATPARRSQRRIFGLAQFRSKAAKAGQGGGDSQAQGGATSSSAAARTGGGGGGVAGGAGGSSSGGNGVGARAGGYGTSSGDSGGGAGAAGGGAGWGSGSSSSTDTNTFTSSSSSSSAAAVKQQQLNPAALAAQDTLYLTRTALLLLHLCQADEAVRAHMLAPSFLKRLLDARESLPPPVLLLLLRVLRQLSADAASHDSLQRADAVRALVPYIDAGFRERFEVAGRGESRTGGGEGAVAYPDSLFCDIQAEALMALYNLCRGSKRRQELAAEASIVPPLMVLISSRSPLLPFALPLLCLLATASRAACDTLLHHNALPLLLSLLATPLTPHAAIAARLADSRKEGTGVKGGGGGGGSVAGGAGGAGAPGGTGGAGGAQGSGEGAERMWGAAAFEAVVACVVNDGEGRHVEQTLLRRDSLEALVWFVRRAAKTPSFTALFEPLLRLVSKSPTLNAALSVGGLGDLLVARLDDPQLEPAVRLNLLKLLKAVYEQHPYPKGLCVPDELPGKLQRLTEERRIAGGQQVLVRQMASALLKGLHFGPPR